ncbi:MAG: protease inhibitor I42 family protein [Desulfobacteraceae bacterium]|nr:protease inhibitor I42 family protein [Desulfobacteraceae bacterium]
MKRCQLVFFSAILVAIAADVNASDGRHQPLIIALTDADNGRSIEMNLADLIQITLPSNITTGYRWENLPIDGSIFVQQGEAVYAEDPSCAGRAGCGGTQSFCFKVDKRGTGKIKLIYRRSWEKGQGAKQFEISVTVR